MSNNADLIRNFISAWSRLDADELGEYFAEDGVYHNMPAGPVIGKARIKQFIAGFIADWTSTEWDIINLLDDGELVMVERVDRTRVGDKPIELPCLGVFEMADGKIRIWRDYFDMGTYVRALS
jgi:limonene-1,2-epoxide hydrolase|tara:strand:- start:3164 stop:3532 length:369 start_codon:yes stop_codon:yes gene_type:complete